LIEAINDIHIGLEKSRVKLTITEYIRWCHSTISLSKLKDFTAKKSAGIAALRVIVDALPNNDRRRITKEIFINNRVPESLRYIIVTDSKD
jgi:hypothetical protein